MSEWNDAIEAAARACEKVRQRYDEQDRGRHTTHFRIYAEVYKQISNEIRELKRSDTPGEARDADIVHATERLRKGSYGCYDSQQSMEDAAVDVLQDQVRDLITVVLALKGVK